MSFGGHMSAHSAMTPVELMYLRGETIFGHLHNASNQLELRSAFLKVYSVFGFCCVHNELIVATRTQLPMGISSSPLA